MIQKSNKIIAVLLFLLMSLVSTGCDGDINESESVSLSQFYSVNNDLFAFTYETQIDELLEITSSIVDIQKVNFLEGISYAKGRIDSANDKNYQFVYHVINQRYVTTFPNQIVSDGVWQKILELTDSIQGFVKWLDESISQNDEYEDVVKLLPEMNQLREELLAFLRSNLKNVDEAEYIDQINKIKDRIESIQRNVQY